MAVFIMGANISGIIGSQLFQAEDAPLYRTGWTVSVVLVSTGFLLAGLANLQYWLLNRFQKRQGDAKYKY